MTHEKPISPRKAKRVTAKDVADAAGVSRSAVSRAFTQGAYLDAEKRARIEKVADQLGYQPNALAASLQGGSSNLVAIFVGNIRSEYDTTMVNVLVRRLNELGKWPLLIDGSGAQAKEAINEVLRFPLDALILRSGSMAAEIAGQCAKLGIPMISSGRILRAPHVDNVCCKNADGMAAAAELLLSTGRKRIGLITGPSEYSSADARRDGARAVLNAAGMDFAATAEGDYSSEGGHKAAQHLLANHDLDSLLCTNDASAIGALAAAREMGIVVPDDLAVVGFDDAPMAKWAAFNLTTVRNPIDESVEQIISLLQKRLAKPDRPDQVIEIEPKLILRGTH